MSKPEQATNAPFNQDAVADPYIRDDLNLDHIDFDFPEWTPTVLTSTAATVDVEPTPVVSEQSFMYQVLAQMAVIQGGVMPMSRTPLI